MSRLQNSHIYTFGDALQFLLLLLLLLPPPPADALAV
jgi:hypothetical protein